MQAQRRTTVAAVHAEPPRLRNGDWVDLNRLRAYRGVTVSPVAMKAHVASYHGDRYIQLLDSNGHDAGQVELAPGLELFLQSSYEELQENDSESLLPLILIVLAAILVILWIITRRARR